MLNDGRFSTILDARSAFFSVFSVSLWCIRSRPPRRRSAAIQPRGAQRGTEAVAHLHRRPARRRPGMLVYYPGITVKKLEVVNDAPLKATVDDRRRTAGSASTPSASAPRPASRELRTFWVGALPVVEEKEPNNEFDKPQPIPLNVTVHGVVDNEDVDYFVVECKKGQRLSVEVEGHAARRHVLRPVRRDPRRQALRAGHRRRLAARRPGRRVLGRRSRPTASTSSRSARAPTAATARASTGCTSAPSRGRRRRARRRQAGRGARSHVPRRPAGPIKQKVKLPADDDHGYWRLHCQTADGISPTGLQVPPRRPRPT